MTELDREGLTILRDRYVDQIIVGIQFWEKDAHVFIWNINIFFMSVVAIAIVCNYMFGKKVVFGCRIKRSNY